MITINATLTANTANLAISTPCLVRQIVYNTGAAGTLTAYSFGAAQTTQNNPAYDTRTRDCSYTREVTGVRDISCNTGTYDFDGISDTDTTVAADATADLPILAALGLPAAGQVASDVLIPAPLGLVLLSTVNATVQVVYEPLFP